MDAMSEIPVWITARRSIRRFRPDPVPHALLARCVEAAGWAPSASNRQDWRFDGLTSPAARAAFDADLRDAARGLAPDDGEGGGKDGSAARTLALREWRAMIEAFSWKAAPVALAVSCKPPPTFLALDSDIDADALSGAFASAAMATQNFMLAATAFGLATCCFTAPLAAADVALRHFRMPVRRRPVCLLAVGFPDESPAPPPRRPVESILFFADEERNA